MYRAYASHCAHCILDIIIEIARLAVIALHPSAQEALVLSRTAIEGSVESTVRVHISFCNDDSETPRPYGVSPFKIEYQVLSPLKGL